MRCAYCHNPDTWSREAATEMTAGELLDRAERFRSYWGQDGGITVSGGEALLQLGFVTELFEEAHRRGINTCLDTAAQPFRREAGWLKRFDRLMKATDLVLFDIKHIDPEGHRALTGHPNGNILGCARYLSDLHKPVWIRHVLVPGVTDDDALLHRLRAFIDTLANVERVEVLPYHALGAFKWAQLGMRYSLDGVQPPTRERVDNARQILGAK